MPDFRPLPFSHLLGTIAMVPTVIGLGMVVAMASAHAQDSETAKIVLHHAAKPADRVAQRRLRRRIESAALSLCGGGGGALVEVDRAVRNSPCWHDAVARANAQIAR